MSLEIGQGMLRSCVAPDGGRRSQDRGSQRLDHHVLGFYSQKIRQKIQGKQVHAQSRASTHKHTQHTCMVA